MGAALLAGVLPACARPPPRPTRVANAPVERTNDTHILFDQISPFGRVLVLDEGARRVMRFGSLHGSEQSAIVRGEPRAVPVEYVRYALLGLAYHGHPTHILMVGLGGGTFSTLVHRALPEATIDVVEIDPVVATAAHAYFGLREDEGYRVHIANAADWMARDHGAYDYVLLDAYAGEEIPRSLATDLFFRDVARRLAPGGVVAINIAEIEAQGIAVARAFHSAFMSFDCRRAPTDGNLVLYGSRGPRIKDRDKIRRWLDDWDAQGWTDFSLRALANPLEGPSGGPDCARVLQTSKAADTAPPLRP